MRASYNVLREGETVHRTVEVAPHLVVDLDEHGWVLGIESADGMVTKGDLRKVISCMRWPEMTGPADVAAEMTALATIASQLPPTPPAELEQRLAAVKTAPSSSESAE